jgi:hypothetical protein
MTSDIAIDFIPCPYCAAPLRWTPHHHRGSFECGRCGEFPDFRKLTPADDAATHPRAAGSTARHRTR